MGDSDSAMQAKGVRDLAPSLLTYETQSISPAEYDAPFGDVFAWLANAHVPSDRSEAKANSHNKTKEALTYVLVAVHLVASTIMPVTAVAGCSASGATSAGHGISRAFRTFITGITFVSAAIKLAESKERPTMTMSQKLSAEFLGTFWLTFGGCGSAVLAAAFPQLGIGFAGVSLAFGLTVLTMAYAVGHISGGHFNPAVTVGLAVAGRFPAGSVLPYIIVQVLAGIVAAALLYIVASGKPGFEVAGFASNGYGDLSPGKYGMMSALVMEVLMTFFFLIVILGATSSRAPSGFAPIAIGLALTLIHLISIPVTNTSVNPARSTGPALFGGAAYLGQLWMFWVAPMAGAALAGVAGQMLFKERDQTLPRALSALPEKSPVT